VSVEEKLADFMGGQECPACGYKHEEKVKECEKCGLKFSRRSTPEDNL